MMLTLTGSVHKPTRKQAMHLSAVNRCHNKYGNCEKTLLCPALQVDALGHAALRPY